MRWLVATALVAASIGCGRVAHAGANAPYVGIANALATLRGARSFPVLLPTENATRTALSDGASDPLYVSLRTPNPGDAYALQVSNVAKCQSTPCTVFAIEGSRTHFMDDPGRRGAPVKLAQGIVGTYAAPYGTNVSDGTITWKTAGSYYRLSVKEGHRAPMIAMADSAIIQGPRHRL